MGKLTSFFYLTSHHKSVMQKMAQPVRYGTGTAVAYRLAVVVRDRHALACSTKYQYLGSLFQYFFSYISENHGHERFCQLSGQKGRGAGQSKAEFGHEQTPACLGDQQRAGGKIPGFERDLKEDVLAAAGDMRQIQRGRAAAADIGGAEQETQRQLHAALGERRMIGRGAEGHQRPLKRMRGNSDFFAIERCAAAFYREEQFVCIWLIDRGEHGLFIFQQRDGYGGLAIIVDEVAGAVHRIDDPGRRIGERVIFLLLADEAGAGQQRGERFCQVILQRLYHQSRQLH